MSHHHRPPPPGMLHHASDAGQVEQYFRNNPTSAVNARDELGNTPLHTAVANGNLGVVRALLECPAIDAHVPNNKGETAMSVALRHMRHLPCWNELRELLGVAMRRTVAEGGDGDALQGSSAHGNGHGDDEDEYREEEDDEEGAEAEEEDLTEDPYATTEDADDDLEGEDEDEDDGDGGNGDGDGWAAALKRRRVFLVDACPVCMEALRTPGACALQPCGHVMCDACLSSLRVHTCAMCRAPIELVLDFVR